MVSPKCSDNNCSLQIGTMNICGGLKSPTGFCSISSDMAHYNLDILCLQETKITNTMESQVDGYHHIYLPSSSIHYGLGFILNKNWSNALISYESLSDRIAAIRFKIPEKNEKFEQHHKQLIVINAYAPHMGRSKAEKDEFYYQLTNFYESFNKEKQLIIIAGDFNAKIGHKIEDETNTGHFTRGIRNKNGSSLLYFCSQFQLYISNSHFNHRARRITTWAKNLKSNNIFNQIDYILIPLELKGQLYQSRSYINTNKGSDHRLVKTHISLKDNVHFSRHYSQKRKKRQQWDFSELKKYKQEFHESLNKQLKSQSEKDLNFKDIQKIIKTASTTVLPQKQHLINNNGCFKDPEYQRLQKKED